jgi:hypothetical protein
VRLTYHIHWSPSRTLNDRRGLSSGYPPARSDRFQALSVPFNGFLNGHNLRRYIMALFRCHAECQRGNHCYTKTVQRHFVVVEHDEGE